MEGGEEIERLTDRQRAILGLLATRDIPHIASDLGLSRATIYREMNAIAWTLGCERCDLHAIAVELARRYH